MVSKKDVNYEMEPASDASGRGNHSLKIDARRDKIMELLEQEGQVRVTQLAELLGATTVTIRSDLDSMEQDGLVERVPGGAVPTTMSMYNREFLRRKRMNTEEKRALANAVVEEVEDGDTLFLNCSAWDSARNSLASNIANSLSKGMTVIAQGRLTQRSYQAQDGSQRTVVELRVDDIGPSLRRATAQVNRQSSSSGFVGNQQQGGFNGGYQGGAGYAGGANGFGAQGAPQQQAQAPVSDPWNSAEPSGSSFGSFGTSEFGGGSDEPEF